MTKLLQLLTCLAIVIPVSVMADEEASDKILKHRKVVIINADGDSGKSLTDVIEMVRAETDGDVDLSTFFSIDDDGIIHIDKSEESMNGHIVKVMKLHGEMGKPHALHFAAMTHGGNFTGFAEQPMSDAAATCVLKNISKVQTDGAVHLLKKACQTLNPAEDPQ